MITVLHNIIHAPASNWYHLAAFILTGAGAQYTVQLVKVVNRHKLSKSWLRFLNGSFSTLYVAAGALLSGGIGLGEGTKTAAAVAAVSALIYRVHNSFLYKSAEAVVDAANPASDPLAAPPLAAPPLTSEASFADN